MSENLTLTAEDAGEITCGWLEKVAEQDVSKHRWYTKKLIVFRDGEGEVMPDDALYGFHYNDPVTEDALDDADRFESDPVKVFRVVAKEYTTTVYEVAA